MPKHNGVDSELGQTGFKWEQPGPILRDSKNTYLTAALRELKGTPNSWALIRQYKNSSSANTLASSIRKKYPAFETTSRGRKVYARYVGISGEVDITT